MIARRDPAAVRGFDGRGDIGTEMLIDGTWRGSVG